MYAGSSDIATLTLVGIDAETKKVTAALLPFGADSVYRCTLVTGKDALPEYYKKKNSFSHWLKVYDDDGLVLDITLDAEEKKTNVIDVYRSGDCAYGIYTPQKLRDNMDEVGTRFFHAETID